MSIKVVVENWTHLKLTYRIYYASDDVKIFPLADAQLKGRRDKIIKIPNGSPNETYFITASNVYAGMKATHTFSMSGNDCIILRQYNDREVRGSIWIPFRFISVPKKVYYFQTSYC